MHGVSRPALLFHSSTLPLFHSSYWATTHSTVATTVASRASNLPPFHYHRVQLVQHRLFGSIPHVHQGDVPTISIKFPTGLLVTNDTATPREGRTERLVFHVAQHGLQQIQFTVVVVGNHVFVAAVTETETVRKAQRHVVRAGAVRGTVVVGVPAQESSTPHVATRETNPRIVAVVAFEAAPMDGALNDLDDFGNVDGGDV